MLLWRSLNIPHVYDFFTDLLYTFPIVSKPEKKIKQSTYFRFSDYGTMLEIRDIQYFDDGRSVVDTIGGKRFRVLSRGVKDGYNTAKVEYLHDDTVEGNELESTYS